MAWHASTRFRSARQKGTSVGRNSSALSRWRQVTTAATTHTVPRTTNAGEALLRPVVIGGAVLVAAAAHPQRESPHPIQAHDPPMLVIRDPQPLAARGAVRALGREHTFLRHGARPAATTRQLRLLGLFWCPTFLTALPLAYRTLSSRLCRPRKRRTQTLTP